jgi:sulfonate transport system permease protein
VARGWWPNTLIPTPVAVVEDLWRLTRSGELPAHSYVSLTRLVLGYGLGSALGVLVGTAVGVSRGAERLLGPTLTALAPVPPTAWIPLLIILLGIEERSKVALITIGVFTVVYANVVQGIRGVDRQLVEVAEVFEKPRSTLVAYVLLPGAAPAIFTGMRVALGLSWVLLIAAEMISARMVSIDARLHGLGLGWLIQDARRFGRMDDMVVGMITIGLLGALTDRLLRRLQDVALTWRRTFEGT